MAGAFPMTERSYLDFAAMIAAAGGIALALHLIWRHLLCPTYRLLTSVGKFAEAQPILLSIAHEFWPNDGDSLRDQIDSVNVRLGNIEGQMEIIVQHVGVWDGADRRTS